MTASVERMQAVWVRQHGGPESLELTELPVPVPAPGQVRVKAHAIGAGRPDVLIRNGSYKWMPPLPAIPGNEMAGVVDALGEGATCWSLGDRVLLSSRELPQRGGGYAEYQCAPADGLYALPASIGFDDAVSLPNFQLALAMMASARSDRATRAVLITGAAGGVATALAQVARVAGAKVIGIASSEAKRRFALDCGFDDMLDTRTANLPEQVRGLTAGCGVDLAFDHIGGHLVVECLRALAPLGTLVSYNIAAGAPATDLFMEMRAHLGRSLALRVFSMHSFDADAAQRRRLMQDAIDAMAAGSVRAPRATVLPLAQAREAHRIMDAGQTIGKIVLHPASV